MCRIELANRVADVSAWVKAIDRSAANVDHARPVGAWMGKVRVGVHINAQHLEVVAHKRAATRLVSGEWHRGRRCLLLLLHPAATLVVGANEKNGRVGRPARKVPAGALVERVRAHGLWLQRRRLGRYTIARDRLHHHLRAQRRRQVRRPRLVAVLGAIGLVAALRRAVGAPARSVRVTHKFKPALGARRSSVAERAALGQR
mmetsp:Transcript_3892/g.10146  ORF Transcript_3892/g.10146 Transcript_3892/m.10146 type:complete len:202 (+) Transcript_3892:545-1150(+)